MMGGALLLFELLVTDLALSLMANAAAVMM